MKKKRPRVSVPLIAGGIIGALLLADFITVSRPYRPHVTDVSEGVQYVEALNQKDTDSVDAYLASQARKEQQKEAEKLRKQIESGDVDPFKLFRNYCIAGDSRANDLKDYGLLEERRVVADVGWDMSDVAEHIDEIKALNPLNLFIECGLNDIDLEYDSADSFAATYEKHLKKIQAAVPDATIYVNSIFPCNEHGISNHPNYAVIPEANEALKPMCEKNGWIYIDNDQITEDHPEYYEHDGIHFFIEFDTLWAANMLTAQIEHDSLSTTEAFSAVDSSADALSVSDENAD